MIHSFCLTHLSQTRMMQNLTRRCRRPAIAPSVSAATSMVASAIHTLPPPPQPIQPAPLTTSLSLSLPLSAMPHHRFERTFSAHSIGNQTSPSSVADNVNDSSTTPSESASSSRRIALTVTPVDARMRLDRWLRAQLNAHPSVTTSNHLPSSLLERLCRSKHIRLDTKHMMSTRRTVTVTHHENDDDGDADSPQAPTRSKLSGRYRVQPGDRILIPSWLMQRSIERPDNEDGSSTALPPSTKRLPAFGGPGGANTKSHSNNGPPIARLPMSSQEIRALRNRILYEDNELIVLNKPAGLPVHGGSRHGTRHLVGLLGALNERDEQTTKSVTSPSPVPPQKLHLVHRLDKDTSGCLLLAKNRHVAQILCDLLAKPPLLPQGRIDMSQGGRDATTTMTTKNAAPITASTADSAAGDETRPMSHTDTPQPFIRKRYIAIVHGRPKQDHGILRSPGATGQSDSISSYRLLAHASSAELSQRLGSSATASLSPPLGSPMSSSFSLLQLELYTGRKRQLRLHCAWELGCAIVGEKPEAITNDDDDDDDDGCGGRAHGRRAHRSTSSNLIWKQRYKAEEMLSRAIGIQSNNNSSNSNGQPSMPPLPLMLHAISLSIFHPDLQNLHHAYDRQPQSQSQPQPQQLNVIAPLPNHFDLLLQRMFGSEWSMQRLEEEMTKRNEKLSMMHESG